MPVTTHSALIAAPAKVIYDLIADAPSWPYVFSPTVFVQRVPLDGNQERLRLWALAHGEIRTWASRRTLDPEALRITFQQVVSSPPVESMGGEWILTPETDGTTKVTLLHDFRAINDDPASIELIESATDRNSNAELEALKRAAELGDTFEKLVLTFADSVLIDAAPADIFDFLWRAERWPDELPHVTRLDLTESAPDLQVMEMDTISKDGSVHTTKSVRVGFPHESIVYKQIVTPEVMSAHTGRWSLKELSDGVELTSQHTVVIRPEALVKLLGPDATIDQARELIQQALSKNSLTTMTCAKLSLEKASAA